MQTPPEVRTALLVSLAFWPITTLVILIAGRYYPRVRGFRDRMRAHWKPALLIAGLYVLGMGIGIGRRGFLNLYALAVFCQALIGLTIASGTKGCQPLPVANAFVQRKQVLRQVIPMLVISVFVVVPAFLIGSIGWNIGHYLFGEANPTREAASTFPPNKWLTFFSLLSGAGIAEETPYRLVLIPLIWKVTKRKWLAIVLSGLAFGAYHLTPLDGMYRIFWQYPISQVLDTTLKGMIWGYLFTKRGYETTVLAHTLQDWLPLMIFAG